MKWVAISGSWRKTNKKVEKDVRRIVRKIILRGDGIVSGGALNVDYFAVDEAMKLDFTCRQIKVFIPATLKIFAKHYLKRAQEGIITKKQTTDLIGQLTRLKQTNLFSIIENKTNIVLDKTTYYERNSEIINIADELVAFQVDESLGTQDAINKAIKRGIPVKIFKYEI